MKVMCIDDKWEGEGVTINYPCPKFGEVVTVTDAKTHSKDGFLYYQLLNYPNWYEASAFVPISDIDETEMVRERLLQTA